MNVICGDNRFEIIDKAKKDLLESTNIETSEDEMKVLDSFLFRCWQMGWLDRYIGMRRNRMKAIVVFDVDEKEIGREVNYISVKAGGMSYIVGTMKSGVRLKPLPQAKQIFYGSQDEIKRNAGWNECLKEILGEE